jgi:homoserine/homoserine lactone efflux protein
MSWSTWSAFVALNVVLDLTPGPAVLYVISSALRGGTRTGVGASAGILSANLFYFAISATGLGALILDSYNLFFAIKWLGAAYLMYLGTRSLLARNAAVLHADLLDAPPGAYRGAVFTQLSNPKAIVYFTAILPQFIDVKGSIAGQIVIFGLTSTVCEFLVLSSYSLAAGRAALLTQIPAFARWTSRGSGILLICAGLGLAVLPRG